MMRIELFRLNGAVRRNPAVATWFRKHSGELGDIAREWFDAIRDCGEDVHEVKHDDMPTACLGDAASGYVNVFSAHVNVGFFQGSELPDAAGILQGNGRFMRHVKLIPGKPVNDAALSRLIETAYSDIKARINNH